MSRYDKNKDLPEEFDYSLDDILGDFKFVSSDPELENIILEVKDDGFSLEDKSSSELDFSIELEEDAVIYTAELDDGVSAPEEVEIELPEVEEAVEEESVEEEDTLDFTLDEVIASINSESTPPESAEDIEESEDPEESENVTSAEVPEENVFTEHENIASEEDDYVIDKSDFPAEYAEGDIDYAEAQAELEETEQAPVKKRSEARSFREKVVNPVIKVLAYATMRIQQSKAAMASAPAEEAEDLGEELSPAKAAKFYESKINGLRLRTRISFILSIIITYISLGLPVFGSIRATAVSAVVCLIMLLTVMMLGLDILTSGFLALAGRKPNANSLVALSCLLSCIDGFIVALGTTKNGLPFCAVSALTVSFSLMGSYLNCQSNRISLRAAASAKRPYTVTAEASVTGDGITLLKSRDINGGFVRRVEESGPDEIAYGTMSPYIIAVAFVLSIIAAAITKNFAGIMHIFSGLVAAAVPVSILFVFPLPFFVSSKIMIHSGSSIAGWSGLYDIGKSKQLIITDRDLFPKNDVTIEAIRFVDGSDPEKAISYAGSMIIASGSTLAPAFSDLIAKGNGTLLKVDEFSCHESGGLVALINGEEVFCGSSGFMQLMGVRLPNKYSTHDRVFVAASGALCGFFDIKYNAQRDVKAALASIFRTDRHPIFAVRDFNVTPQMISRKFDIPTDGFDFPAFTDRYEISAAKPSDVSKPAAIISHEGLGALVELADRGRFLYNVVRVCVMMSILSAVLGMLIMFIKMAAGTASVAGLLIYMVIWLVPEIAACFFLIKNNY